MTTMKSIQQQQVAEMKLLTEELVSAASKPVDDYAETSNILRTLMRLSNLDFVYIFGGRPDLDKIKTSLAKVLCHYPTLAGRLEGNEVHLNNHGVAFKIQQLPSSSIQEIPRETPTGPPYCFIPSPMEQSQGKAPLLTVTVTLFQDGWTLGVVMNHIVVDGSTFANFMKHWSDIYNGNSTSIENLTYQMPKNFKEASQNVEADAKALGLVCASKTKTFLMKAAYRWLIPTMAGKQDMRTGITPDRFILQFTKEQLQKIKQTAEQCNNKTWISTNEALMAHVWKLLMDATGLPTEQRSCVAVTLPANLRNRLPNLSANYIGNAVASITMFSDMTKSDRAQQIHNNLRAELATEKIQLRHRFANLMWNDDTPFSYLETKHGDVAFGGLPGCMIWNSQATNPYYQVDFGTGPPVRGIFWCLPPSGVGVTVLPSCCHQGGVDVYITGAMSWKKDTGAMTWSTISATSALISLVGSWASSGAPMALLWFVCFGMLAWKTGAYATQEVAKAKKEIEDYCQRHCSDLLI